MGVEKKNYRKFPTISPRLIFVFRGSLFSEGQVIGGNFAFQNGLGSTT